MESNQSSNYTALNEWLTEAETRLERLNTELAALPQGFAHPAPRPEGFAAPSAVPQRTRSEIQQDKDQEKADTFERIEQATEQVPLATRQQLRDTAFARLYAEEIQRVAEQEWGPPEANWGLADTQTKMRQEISEFRQRQRESNQPEPRLIDRLTDRFWEKSATSQPSSSTTPTANLEGPDEPDEPER